MPGTVVTGTSGAFSSTARKYTVVTAVRVGPSATSSPPFTFGWVYQSVPFLGSVAPKSWALSYKLPLGCVYQPVPFLTIVPSCSQVFPSFPVTFLQS